MLAIRAAGYSVLGVEYRGWGESTQLVPSEDSIYADAEFGWREMVLRQPDPRRRVIYGHSMGAAVAVELAAGSHSGLHRETPARYRSVFADFAGRLR
ncbi:MAG: lysophospholipase [Burkholderiaceae bacterium]|nr:lysophospholipase [Burkholderiaceae bacterium]